MVNITVKNLNAIKEYKFYRSLRLNFCNKCSKYLGVCKGRMVIRFSAYANKRIIENRKKIIYYISLQSRHYGRFKFTHTLYLAGYEEYNLDEQGDVKKNDTELRCKFFNFSQIQ